MHGRIGTLYLARQHSLRKHDAIERKRGRATVNVPSGHGMSDAAMFLRLGLVVLIAMIGVSLCLGLDG